MSAERVNELLDSMEKRVRMLNGDEIIREWKGEMREIKDAFLVEMDEITDAMSKQQQLVLEEYQAKARECAKKYIKRINKKEETFLSQQQQ
jgi:L-lactate utilization protein LutB